MNKRVFVKVEFRWAAVGLSVLLMAALGGCGRADPTTFQEFVVDLARGALAAWLL